MNRHTGRRRPVTESERDARRTARRRRAAGELQVRRLCRTMPALSPCGLAAAEARILDITAAGHRLAAPVVTA